MTHSLPRAIKNWLITCAVLVLMMAVIGAITRLTESGLSMTTWHATKDILPPLDETSWQAEFAKYKQYPEYQQLNKGMSLSEFKYIYFWEWLHRLWGRLIGLAFVLPLAWFWAKGQVPAAYKKPFLLLLALGAAQGFMGWYMVKSGLVDRPSVSHFRLAAHLSLAMIIFCVLCWQIFRANTQSVSSDLISSKKLQKLWIATLTILGLTMVWGAYVAGLDAGMIYNEFPKMGGRWFPSDGLFLQPAWHNFFYTHSAVQWLHRMLGTISLLTVCSFAYIMLSYRTSESVSCNADAVSGAKTRPPIKAGVTILVSLVFTQFILGIATLLSGVNIALAALHQANAFLILAAMMYVGVGLFTRPQTHQAVGQ